MPQGLLLCVLAYLIGSIPTGIIVSKKFSNIDIQSEGSRNIGATNVARLLGKKFGALTLLGDVAKGIIPVILAAWWMGPDNTGVEIWVSLVALFCVIGHMYPIFLKFKGGKGIATSTGVFLVIAPLGVLLNILVFLIVLAKWRFVSLGSLSAALCMPILVALFPNSMFPNPKVFVSLAVVVSILILYRHRENMKRLVRGEERKWGRSA